MRLLTVSFVAGMLAGASPAPPSMPPRHCFSPAQFDGWRAADAKTIYIRADVNHYYRISLARECSTLAFPDAQLILDVHDGGTICSAADMVIRATQPFVGVPEPCFVKDMTELSPAEAAAIPPAQRP
jgi:hypothetical protein